MVEVVSKEDFKEKLENRYIMLWKYGKHSDKQFRVNMHHLGYEEEEVETAIKNYYSPDEE